MRTWLVEPLYSTVLPTVPQPDVPLIVPLSAAEAVAAADDGRPGDEIVRDLPRTENKRFYPALDGLRAFAVLLVFYQHYEASYYLGLNWGWVGVDFFFVLSGFLITGILYDTRETPHRFRNFYVRRTLRIFPLYYGVLLVALLTAPIFHFAWHPAWLLWATYLGNYVRFIYLHDPLFAAGALEHLRTQPPYAPAQLFLVGHFWSLCIEEQFYLVWPLVVFAVRNRERLRNLCITVCLLTLAARIACVILVPKEYLQAELLYRATPLRADALLLGGLIALALRGPEALWVRRLARPMLAILLGSFFLFDIAWKLFSAKHGFFRPEAGAPGVSTIGYTLVDWTAAALILCILEPGGILFRIFDLKPLRWLGQISYGFYVFHDIFHYDYIFAARTVIPTVGVAQRHLITLIALVSTTALSYLSFRFFESPFLRLKERWTVRPAEVSR